MGFFGSSKKSGGGSGAKNPQSGANSFSSSSGQSHSESQESSDINVPTVNLTEQRLQDWRAGGAALSGGGGNNNNNVAGGNSLLGAPNSAPPNIIPSGPAAAVGAKNPPRNYTTSPNNLILLIERGQWREATERATTHEHEVKQLVKLRKTTKNSGGGSSAAAGAEGAASSSGGGGASHHNQGGGGGGGGSSRRNVQISNVKCKALHHACQKLRSVHTSIYQKNVISAAAVDNASSSSNNNGNTRRIIEEDEYIEACKCILTLISVHPEACKERESRHGCLPLHLCVFSMCATPPPPLPTTMKSADMTKESGSGGRTASPKKGHHRTNSSGAGGRPPVVSSRSISAPPQPLNLPQQQQQSNKKGAGHRTVHSNGSTDFSLGNISQMIQEESEHQAALTTHRQNSKMENVEGTGSSIIDEQIHKVMENTENMERLLIGLESRYGDDDDKKSRGKKKKSKDKGSVKSGSEREAEQQQANTPTTTTTTTVVNAMTPMDALEERSRETDSHSTPHVTSSDKFGSLKSDERTGAQVVQREEDEGPSYVGNVHSGNNSNDITAGISSEVVNDKRSKAAEAAVSHESSPTSWTSTTPTHEDLQRRYLQINTQRRDEYSVRVINALLDAWPKSIKTSSEGGRLPLHMACFGKATVKAMETILKAYPDAARQRNHDGFLPIHIAAHWGVSHPDIAPLILRAYPDGAVGRNRWERTPIEEALGMAGENGRSHQLSLVWSLRRHPTYWIHNDIQSMLLPRNVRLAPWRMVDVGEQLASNNEGGNAAAGGGGGMGRGRMRLGGGGGAVDVDEVGSSDEDDEGVEVQMAHPSPPINDPTYIRALADSTDLSLLITKDKHWSAAALRCRSHPHEAREAMEVKVRGAYTAKITPLHYACENKPTVEVVRALIASYPPALERRQEPGGQLPLHAACTWGASSDVIKALLSARPSCAEMKDFLSNLPLHCACYSGAETAVIEALLKVYPQSVWPRNHQGSSAVDIVRRLGHPNRREVLRLLESTMGRLLARAAAGEEGVEVDQDNSLEWV